MTGRPFSIQAGPGWFNDAVADFGVLVALRCVAIVVVVGDVFLSFSLHGWLVLQGRD